jgi:HSP20 family protein
MRNNLSRYEARFFEPFFRFPFVQEEAQSATWNPPVDVVEENNQILVKVEVPGIDEKDLRIMFEDGTLTVTGERQFERKDDRSYHRIERAYGTFTRTFTLPRSVDAARIAAEYRNGVLEVHVKKPEQAKPRRIEIATNGNTTIEGSAKKS